jgi:hypothetical protein
VFFANENEDTLFRIIPGSSVVEVATPSNGASAVVGPADIDDDGSPELIYTANSDTNLNYLDNIESIDGSGDIFIRDLTDESGNQISGDDQTGTT